MRTACLCQFDGIVGIPGYKTAVNPVVPRKDCTSFLVNGRTWFLMEATLQAGMDTYPLPTVWTRNVSEAEPNWHLDGLAIRPASRGNCKTCCT